MVVGPTVKRFSGMRLTHSRPVGSGGHDLKNDSVLRGNKFSVCPLFQLETGPVRVRPHRFARQAQRQAGMRATYELDDRT